MKGMKEESSKCKVYFKSGQWFIQVTHSCLPWQEGSICVDTVFIRYELSTLL